jgi:RNA polymerase sigma-70 factor, ECF subfamily
VLSSRQGAHAGQPMQLGQGHAAVATADGYAAIGFRARTTPDQHDGALEVGRAVARAQAGDMGAIRFLYVRYKDNVYGYVLSIVGDPHEAEDVTQHVFLKLIGTIGRYQAREVPFSSWLFRVARNMAVDHLRQRRAIPCEEIHEPSTEADEAGRERRAGIEHALRALPDEQRHVVVLRHLVGLTPGEIAVRMGRSESSIHGLHHRARKSIRGQLIDVDCAPTARAGS